MDLIQNSVEPNGGFVLTSVCLDQCPHPVTPEITFASLRIKILLIFKFHYPKSSDTFSNIALTVTVQSCLKQLSLLNHSACKEEALSPCAKLPHFFPLSSDHDCWGSLSGFPCLTRLPMWRLVRTKPHKSVFQDVFSWNLNFNGRKKRIRRERPLMHCRVRLWVSYLAFAHCVKFLPFHFRGRGSACCLKALLLITRDPIFYLCFLVFHQGSSLPSPKLMHCIPSVQRHASKRLTPVSPPFKYW